MTRSKAIARFRREHAGALGKLDADRSGWRYARADRARSLADALSEQGRGRADFRRVFLDQLREKLEAFSSEQGRSRLAQASERAVYMENLVGEVNRLIADYARASAERDAAISALSRGVREFLSDARAKREETSVEQASRNNAFRGRLSAAVQSACTNDFR